MKNEAEIHRNIFMHQEIRNVCMIIKDQYIKL